MLWILVVLHIYTCSCRIHIDAIIKKSEDFFKKIYHSLYCKVCVWEGVGDRTELQYIDPHSYGHQRCVFLVLQGCSTGGPGAKLSAECWLSLPHLITNGSPHSLGVPRASSAGWWLSLPHLVSNSSDLQLNRESRGPFLPDGGFLYHFSNFSGPQLTDFLSSPSYIIVQSPIQYLLNGKFDRHQLEITVMQFRGHSLPVHQSMSVSWDFILSHFVSQARLRDFFT